MDFKQNEITEQVAQLARDFAQKHIRPHVMEWDESQHFPKEIQKVLWLPTGQSLVFERTENGLAVVLPEKTSDYANVIKVLS